MQLHELKPKTIRYKYPRVGRGGKRGKTSGKGTKGQKSRAGRKMRPELRDIIKKFPKLRGYRFKSIKEKPQAVNIGDLETLFAAGAEITPATLVNAKLARRIHGNLPRIKILGTGEISKSFTFSGITVSVSAKAAIEKAGGTITLLVSRRKPAPKKTNVEKKEAKDQAKADAKKAKKDKKEKAATDAKYKKAVEKGKKPKAEKAPKAPKADKTEKGKTAK